MIPIAASRVVGGTRAFNPANVGGLIRWYAARKLIGLSNNDPVSTVTDFGSDAQDATAAGAARPTYKTNIVNGLPVLEFAADVNILTLPTLTSSAITVFVVGYNRDSTSGSCWLGYTGSDQVFLGSFNHIGVGLVWGLGNTTYAQRLDAAINNTWGVLEAYKDGSNNRECAVNGTYSATGGTDTSTPTFDRTGYTFSSAFFIDGYFAEMLVYNSALSVANKNYVRRGLGALYGIPVS
jgi:hypothetical protein